MGRHANGKLGDATLVHNGIVVARRPWLFHERAAYSLVDETARWIGLRPAIAVFDSRHSFRLSLTRYEASTHELEPEPELLAAIGDDVIAQALAFGQNRYLTAESEYALKPTYSALSWRPLLPEAIGTERLCVLWRYRRNRHLVERFLTSPIVADGWELLPLRIDLETLSIRDGVQRDIPEIERFLRRRAATTVAIVPASDAMRVVRRGLRMTSSGWVNAAVKGNSKWHSYVWGGARYPKETRMLRAVGEELAADGVSERFALTLFDRDPAVAAPTDAIGRRWRETIGDAGLALAPAAFATDRKRIIAEHPRLAALVTAWQERGSEHTWTLKTIRFTVDR